MYITLYTPAVSCKMVREWVWVQYAALGKERSMIFIFLFFLCTSVLSVRTGLDCTAEHSSTGLRTPVRGQGGEPPSGVNPQSRWRLLAGCWVPVSMCVRLGFPNYWESNRRATEEGPVARRLEQFLCWPWPWYCTVGWVEEEMQPVISCPAIVWYPPFLSFLCSPLCSRPFRALALTA